LLSLVYSNDTDLAPPSCNDCSITWGPKKLKESNTYESQARMERNHSAMAHVIWDPDEVDRASYTAARVQYAPWSQPHLAAN
jgi:hypothetical protein